MLKMGKAMGRGCVGGEGQKSGCRHTEFEMPVSQPGGHVKQAMRSE